MFYFFSPTILMHLIAGRSDWDDGRWEWEDTPRRDSSRQHQSFRSPMLVGASPDARLVSPWLGGRTPSSSGRSHSFAIII